MKKMLALILTLCLAAMMVSALAETDVTGTWYLVGGEANGIRMDVAMMGIDMEITINADGTATVAMNAYGQSQSADATWTLEGDVLSITANGQALEFKVEEDGYLSVDEGSAIMYLGREKPEAKEFAAPFAAESVEQFNGKWVGTSAAMMGVTLSLSDAGMESFGAMTIEDGKVIMTGKDADGNESSSELQAEFKDGVLVAALDPSMTGGLDMSLVFSLLEDGNLCGTITLAMEGMNVDVQIYYAPAEAAAEPAA